MPEPRQITCPKCAAILRFTPKSEISELTCPKCQQKLRFKSKAQGASGAVANVPRSPGPPNAASPALQPRVAQPASTQAKPAQPRPTQQPTQQPTQPRPTQPGPARRTHAEQRPAAKSSPGSSHASTFSPGNPVPTTTSNSSFPVNQFPMPQVNSTGDGMDWGSFPAASPLQGNIPAFNNPNFDFPAANTGAYSGYSAPKTRLAKKGTGGKVLKYTLIGCGSFIGLCILGIVGLIGLTVLAKSLPDRKTTITLEGFKVDAPGIPAPARGPDQKVVFSRRTSSEFGLATQVVSPFGSPFELVDFVGALQLQGLIEGTPTPISRLGLSGFRFTLQQPGGLRAEQEIFKVDNKSVLMVIYVPGSWTNKLATSKNRLNEETTRSYDNPEAFFNSLRR